MSFIVTVEIPALDRLCAVLENRDRIDIVTTIEAEIVEKLKEAAESGVPRPKFEEVPVTEDHPWKDEAKNKESRALPAHEIAPEPQKAAVEPPKPEPSNAPPVTLEQVQRAAAQLRDAGKLPAVTAMFPEFGIKRLSDLKAEQLPEFAERLRGLGAKL